MAELTVLIIAVVLLAYCATLYSFRLLDGLVMIGKAGSEWLKPAHR
ncbi:MAG: hypothetical protein ACLPKB_24365 [Xanthobacteraceae bacterium]